ncbi:MAG: hypothetical protein NWE99_03695 [Candidatus Bathyarchaeota archaeon]|nr:hypothetical protein [Candidatus Bathyarchaeota archaeon]
MNGLSRKLHELEDNVLGFPPEDDDILLHIGDEDEQLLHDHAQRIRATVKDDAQAIIESRASLEQQEEAAKQLLSRLTDEETAILEQSYEFMSYRVERLVYKWFAAAYPKGKDERVMLRVMWFFREMQKFLHANRIEDYEWNSNRNEDDPNFDDDAWWTALEAKIKAEYPEGIFTKESFEEFERFHDEFIAGKIREYYEAHPEAREALIQGLNKKIEESKK